MTALHADSGTNLPLIPGETCHLFRRKVYHFSGHFRNWFWYSKIDPPGGQTATQN